HPGRRDPGHPRGQHGRAVRLRRRRPGAAGRQDRPHARRPGPGRPLRGPGQVGRPPGRRPPLAERRRGAARRGRGSGLTEPQDRRPRTEAQEEPIRMTVAVAFDPLEPGFLESPYEQYARLRAHDPVHWSELLEGWVVTRYDHVAALLRDPDTSVELENARPT